jgi:tetratricopeptide (TPR) repeat protein
LFARLAVFSGGCTLEWAEAVCDADPETLQSLLDKSLLRRRDTDPEPRLWMLATIREFALDRLQASGDGEAMRRRHAEHVIARVESWGLGVDAFGTGVLQRHDLALAEHDNVRAALEWALDRDPASGLHAALGLEQFWVPYAPDEGMRRIESLLTAAGDVPPELRAASLRDMAACRQVLGDIDEAERLYRESLALFEATGDEEGVLELEHRLVTVSLARGDAATARALGEDDLARSRAAGLRFAEANALGALGHAAALEGDHATALELQRARLDLLREVGGWAWGEVFTLGTMAECLLELGRRDDADLYGREALESATRVGARQETLWILAVLALAALSRGDDERAGRLWGAVEAEEARAPVGRWATERRDYASRLQVAPGTAFDRGLEEGRRLPLADAISFALSV